MAWNTWCLLHEMCYPVCICNDSTFTCFLWITLCLTLLSPPIEKYCPPESLHLNLFFCFKHDPRLFSCCQPANFNFLKIHFFIINLKMQKHQIILSEMHVYNGKMYFILLVGSWGWMDSKDFFFFGCLEKRHKSGKMRPK